MSERERERVRKSEEERELKRLRVKERWFEREPKMKKEPDKEIMR